MKEYIPELPRTSVLSVLWQLTRTQLFHSHMVPGISFTCQSSVMRCFLLPDSG